MTQEAGSQSLCHLLMSWKEPEVLCYSREVFTLSSSDWSPSLCYLMSGDQISHEWLEVGNDTLKIHSFLRVAHKFLMNRKLHVPWTCPSTSMFFHSSLAALGMDGNGNHMSWIILFVHIRKKVGFFPLHLDNILSWRMTETSFKTTCWLLSLPCRNL